MLCKRLGGWQKGQIFAITTSQERAKSVFVTRLQPPCNNAPFSTWLITRNGYASYSNTRHKQGTLLPNITCSIRMFTSAWIWCTHTQTTCCIAPQTRPYYSKYLHNNLPCASCLILCGPFMVCVWGRGDTSFSYDALNRVTSCHHTIHKFHPHFPTVQTLHMQLRTCHTTYNFHDIT